ncbi:phage shock protein operon transcriptional activator [Desulfocurvus sp.]|uniref:phage shock protein operon transcriptional activator n=1 Tax=Desulfocurvus sp. TaxID=2871698 RepID=UPI0025BAA9F7|nr:phage shock protein operon transcriptional activator [Desulfocurvus sp.]MCK9241039.1 phage shock protein operon transcriptional activator [Desulfocurvus sp.]
MRTPPLPEALGQSDAFLEFMERLSAAAGVDRPVLVVGERGTGKELAAGRLHYLSPRWAGPFVALNCAALPETLVESELFGHEAGAFTGAAARRAGRFERADGGTLFLDEIGAMPLPVQEKILRVVEYGSFERVGGSRPVSVDVRVVGATNVDLPALARAGRFKRDLLDRLSFEVLTVPPLRGRPGDVALLARHFAARMAVEMGLEEAPRLSPEVLRALEAHPWPGNVRELKNAVERAVHRARGGPLDAADAVVLDPFASPWRPDADQDARPPAAPDPAAPGSPPAAPAPPGAAPLPASLPDAVRALELDLLRRALTSARHHQKTAARLLGLGYHQFRGLYRKYKDDLDAA